jgi:adenylate cyclase
MDSLTGCEYFCQSCDFRKYSLEIPKERAKRRLSAILAVDLAGYSRLMGTDVGTIAALREIWSEHLNPLVAAHHGRVVKMMGDGALIEFASVVDSVECAVGFQTAMAEYNRQRPDKEPIAFRIGVNLGDIVIDGEDIFGDGVNVAARLEGQAPTNGILVSDAVYAQIKCKVSARFTSAGELTLKNIAEPVRAWRWVGEGMQALALTRAASASDPELPSIAILPFANLSGDPEQDFFADGLVEDIITTLSKLSGLLVIARHTSFVYKNRSVDVRTVAAELGVRYLLDGSVRRTGSRIRIAAQLIDAKAGTHLWAHRYDRTVDDIFAIQNEITLMLVTEMQVSLTEGEQARLRYVTTSNVEAWTHWVQGLSYFRQAVTREQVGAARPCWEKALVLDPSSATLNAMLGFVHYCDARFSWWDDRETALVRAQVYSDRALKLDPENADAHITTSVVLMMRGRYDQAVAHARRAVRLAPGSADAATFACFVLASGFPREAVAQGERAMALSPYYPAYYLGHLGNAYRLAGRTEDAIAAFKAYDARSPGFGLADLVIAYHQSGRLEEARRAAERLLATRRDFTVTSWANTQFHRDAGQLAGEIDALNAAGLPAD